jgi:hypothetical protein
MGTVDLLLNSKHPTAGVPSNGIVNLSAEAEQYAHVNGLVDSLLAMKSLVLSGADLIGSVDVNLVRDPESTADSVICFSVQALASVPEILAFDRRMRDSIFEAIPADNRAYFAVRFDFA